MCSSDLFGGEYHNQYVRNLVEFGLFGLVLFVALMFSIIRKSWDNYYNGDNGFVYGISAGLLFATLSMLIYSLTSDSFITVKPASLYWVFVAIVCYIIEYQHKYSSNSIKLK